MPYRARLWVSRLVNSGDSLATREFVFLIPRSNKELPLRMPWAGRYRRISSSVHSKGSDSAFRFGFGPGFPGARRRPTIASICLTNSSLPHGRPVYVRERIRCSRFTSGFVPAMRSSPEPRRRLANLLSAEHPSPYHSEPGGWTRHSLPRWGPSPHAPGCVRHSGRPPRNAPRRGRTNTGAIARHVRSFGISC